MTMNIARCRHILSVTILAAGLGTSIAACDRLPESVPSLTPLDSMDAALVDTGITSQIGTLLLFEQQLQDSDIRVMTYDGVVTLEGLVVDEDARLLAGQLSGAMVGVRGVRNHLQVASAIDGESTQESIADFWITSRVRSEILADDLSRDFQVRVEASQGVVVLSGKLKHQDDVDYVRQIAQGVNGVRRVDVSALTISRLD